MFMMYVYYAMPAIPDFIQFQQVPPYSPPHPYLAEQLYYAIYSRKKVMKF